LLNMRGEVVGINSSGFTEAQNIGYAIPINDLKIVLPDLYKIKLLRKPFLGLLCNNASDALTEFLGNPFPGGCYVVEVVKGSTLEKAGVQSGDMIYEMNGHPVDIFGEMGVPWSEDKISVMDYVSRLSIGEDIHFVVYRKGERKEFSVTFNYIELPSIHKVYPGYEELDYEVFAGMVVQQLTLNHIQILANQAPGLTQYAEMRNITDPILIVTHVFPNSQVYRMRTLNVGSALNEVNGTPVSTLEDLRKALKQGMGNKFLTLRASDNVGRTTDNIFIAIEWDKIVKEETRLAQDYKYQITETTKDILRVANAQQALDKKDALTAVS